MFALKGYSLRIQPQVALTSLYYQSRLTFLPQRNLKKWLDRRSGLVKRKRMQYDYVPDFMKAVKTDPFDYPLQSREEVRKQIYSTPELNYMNTTVTQVYHDRTIVPIDAPMIGDFKESIHPKITIDISKLGLSSLQKERMIYLLGPRYRGNNMITLNCKQYDNFDQNYAKLEETIKELMIETLRAPQVEIDCIRNPYRHDRYKKLLGRTKEQRDAKRALIKQKKDENYKFFLETGQSLAYHKVIEDLKKEIEVVQANEKAIAESEEPAPEPLKDDLFENLKINYFRR